jgi:hypothetical protein
VYIQMPATLRVSEAPTLLMQGGGGESTLVNYRVRLPHHVVGRVFAAAVLIVGVGRHPDRVDSPRGGRTTTAQQDDPKLRRPARLSTPRVPMMWLNLRILYVLGAMPIVVVLAGFVAVRAQGARVAQDANSRASRHPAPAGRQAIVRQESRL